MHTARHTRARVLAALSRRLNASARSHNSAHPGTLYLRLSLPAKNRKFELEGEVERTSRTVPPSARHDLHDPSRCALKKAQTASPNLRASNDHSFFHMPPACRFHWIQNQNQIQNGSSKKKMESINLPLFAEKRFGKEKNTYIVKGY